MAIDEGTAKTMVDIITDSHKGGYVWYEHLEMVSVLKRNSVVEVV